ncbi:uncharacterized protein LOC100373401 [Saccoglossus kowalevskii]
MINCGVDGCPRSYRKYHSFYKHIVSIHRDRYTENTPPEQIPHDTNPPVTQYVEDAVLSENDISDNEAITNDDDCSAPQTQVQPQDNKINLETCAAQFICGLKERNCLTQATTSDIVENTKTLIQSTVEKIKMEILQRAALQLEGNS